MSEPTQSNADVPSVPGWFQDGFHRFLRRYLRRHFHTIAIDRESRCESQIPADQPLIIYGNHPSWWDPLTAHFLNRSLFPGRQFYAPIDADALEQYKVFGKLGFYGVQMNANRGAAEFLRKTTAILNAGSTAIWMTPEGRFCDARDHSEPLMPGLSHVCSKMQSGWVVPLVLEYVFWEERLPECLALMGDPIRIADHGKMSKADWAERLDSQMRTAQISLSEASMARSSEPFDNLLSGTRGAGFFYDSFRRVKSLVSGRSFRASHGEQFE